MLLFINQIQLGGISMAEKKTVYKLFNIIPISVLLMMLVAGKSATKNISLKTTSLIDKERLIPELRKKSNISKLT